MIWSNRDDHIDRKTEKNIKYDKYLDYQYVKDIQWWWTRLAFHNDGIYAVVLNNIWLPYCSKFLSRWSIPLSIMQSYKDLWWYKNLAQYIQRSNYNSCIVSYWWYHHWVLEHTTYTRNAIEQSLSYNIQQWYLFLTAPTLYQQSLHIQRNQEAKKVKNLKELNTFLQTHTYDSSITWCNPKQWIITKSTSTINYDICKGWKIKYK